MELVQDRQKRVAHLRGRKHQVRQPAVCTDITTGAAAVATVIRKENQDSAMIMHILSNIVLICISGCLLLPDATNATQHIATKKRETRQLSQSFQDTAICTSSLIDYFCSTTWAPTVLNQFAICGLREFHTNQASIDSRRTCAVSERGDFCGAAFTSYDQDGTRLMEIQNNCSVVLESGSSCPSNCHTLLTEFKENLGCCINTYFNGTQLSREVPAVVDYRVWNMCNISLPAEQCDNGLIIDNFSSFHRCSDAEFYHRVYGQALCTPSVGQPYVSFLLNNSRCADLLTEAKDVVKSCSFNEAEFPCELFSEREVASLDSICESSFISGNCSSECKGRLKELSNSLGCCVNHYNTTDSSPLGLSYNLWTSCGVESPRFCESSLKLTIETAGDTQTTPGSGTVSILVELCTIISAVIVTLLSV